MVAGDELEQMTEGEVLAFADSCAQTAWRAEVDLLRAGYQWAVLHAPERLDPARATLPGRERSRLLGGPGTPEVTEFAAAELGARIGRSPYAAARLIGDALDLHHRHPQLWARVQAGEVRASYARHVVRMTRDLEPVEAAYVDAGVVESADGRICWTRFEALVSAKVAQAAPAAAREREHQAARATFAKRLTSTSPERAHAMGSYLIHADIATITTIEAAVEQRAAELPDDVPADVRRVRAVLDLLTGEPVAHPRVQLYVHTYAGTDREPIARLEGHGPVTETWVREILGPTARFTIRPVLDLAGQAPVDAYEIPDRHRQAVHLISPADVFPYGSCTTRALQIDHTEPHARGGASAIGNYGPLTTAHHRIKTHSRWQTRQPFPGIHLWRDPAGQTYLVDHTGTRRLPSTPDLPRPQPVLVEIWRTTNVQVGYEPAARRGMSPSRWLGFQARRAPTRSEEPIEER